MTNHAYMRIRLILLLAVLIAGSAGAGLALAVSSDEDTATAQVALSRGLTVPAASAGHTWAPAGQATLGPGVQTYTGGGQCTANFVFIDAAKHVYLGQAAHCAEVKESHSDGCHIRTRPLGTRVAFNSGGFWSDSGKPVGGGTLAYSSWRTMQRLHESDHTTCAYNDFALVRIDPQYTDQVNPSLPYWGGPSGLNTTGAYAGERLHGYGNSSLRGGATQLSPQTGDALRDDPAAHGWSHTFQSSTPGIPGDSGSAWLDAHGRAIGTLSTLSLSVPIINATGDIARELAYAQQHSGIKGMKLVLGTRQFRTSP
ncbi:MAG: serine protease [Solirubrobacterales bacterium]|nr:serine protease [Solirubrobacterales bacterium]